MCRAFQDLGVRVSSAFGSLWLRAFNVFEVSD